MARKYIYYFYDSIKKDHIVGIAGDCSNEKIILWKLRKVLKSMKLEDNPILVFRYKIGDD